MSAPAERLEGSAPWRYALGRWATRPGVGRVQLWTLRSTASGKVFTVATEVNRETALRWLNGGGVYGPGT
jgi:hypothetical protein